MKDFFRRNGLLILIAAILLALVTAVVSMLLGGRANPVANLVKADGKYSLAIEIALGAGLQNIVVDREEDAKAAMVTARSTSNWESTLTLSKGSGQGIAVDDCVVDEYWNLVGVVAEVGENWCTVRTLIDANTQMGGQLTRTGSAGILEGDLTLMGEGKLKLTYLPENSQLISGDLVSTSGRGGVYPSGLTAGHVEEVRTDVSGMTQYAVIVPETDLNSLKQVFVIKDFDIVE